MSLRNKYKKAAFLRVKNFSFSSQAYIMANVRLNFTLLERKFL